jgi:hypothetical protein
MRPLARNRWQESISTEDITEHRMRANLAESHLTRRLFDGMLRKTMKPTRGNNSPQWNSTFATTAGPLGDVCKGELGVCRRDVQNPLGERNLVVFFR